MPSAFHPRRSSRRLAVTTLLAIGLASAAAASTTERQASLARLAAKDATHKPLTAHTSSTASSLASVAGTLSDAATALTLALSSAVGEHAASDGMTAAKDKARKMRRSSNDTAARRSSGSCDILCDWNDGALTGVALTPDVDTCSWDSKCSSPSSDSWRLHNIVYRGRVTFPTEVTSPAALWNINTGNGGGGWMGYYQQEDGSFVWRLGYGHSPLTGTTGYGGGGPRRTTASWTWMSPSCPTTAPSTRSRGRWGTPPRCRGCVRRESTA